MRPAVKQIFVKLIIHGYLRRERRVAQGEVPAAKRLNMKTAQMLLDAYQRRRLSVLSGFLVPTELLHLYGAAPMFTEYLGPIIAGTKYGTRILEHAESEGFSRDLCAIHRATLGAGLSGVLPKFKLIVATSHLCDGQNKSLEELAHRTGVPYILLDVPQKNSPAAVDYLAGQLKELEEKLVELTGKRAKPSDWERLISISNKTRELMLRVNQIRRHRPSPLYGQEAFNFALLAMLMVGTRFLHDCYHDLVSDLGATSCSKRNNGERYRILWLLGYPYFEGNFISYLENKLGVHAVAEELGYVFWSPLDAGRPHRSLATKMLQNPNLGPVTNRVGLVERLVREYRVDGILHFSHWGCRQGCGGVRPIADAVQKLGVPLLELDGDCIDNRNYSAGQTLTRLEGFVELMEKRRQRRSQTKVSDGFYLGIDIGSLTAKAVVIDSAGQILFQEVIHTGASSRRAAARLKEMVFENGKFAEKIRRCIATGYGRTAVDFADAQVTEITCHARGMTRQISGVRTIIDIGGQDTKAIAVENGGVVQRFVMNDKCAAGTGRFLEMMARTLEVDLEELGPQALQAKHSVTISSLCTVFAESEVVSLIAEGKPVQEIARGICESIAARTVAMLGRVGKEKKIAMSGGVAKNIGVVKALERTLGTCLEIPAGPQIIGAFGAALIAREGTG